MSITVVRAGLLTTVQDGGRWGLQELGVPVSGPMDPLAMRLANLLVGNRDGEAALEVTLLGPELLFDAAADLVVSGADLSAAVHTGGAAMRLERWTPVRLAAGASLRFGDRRTGARAYVAVRGGLDVPAVLGSRATSVQARFQGLAGRALRAGDVLPIGNRAVREPQRIARESRGLRPLAPGLDPTHAAAVRFIWGPDAKLFARDELDRFLQASYRISVASNRMGYRLEGPALHVEGGGRLLSEATPIGSLQVPPSGEPILLMADRQTSGGYARIGTVISADIGIAGQLAPGDTIRFVPCGQAEAIRELRDQETALAGLGAVR